MSKLSIGLLLLLSGLGCSAQKPAIAPVVDVAPNVRFEQWFRKRCPLATELTVRSTGTGVQFDFVCGDFRWRIHED